METFVDLEISSTSSGFQRIVSLMSISDRDLGARLSIPVNERTRTLLPDRSEEKMQHITNMIDRNVSAVKVTKLLRVLIDRVVFDGASPSSGSGASNAQARKNGQPPSSDGATTSSDAVSKMEKRRSKSDHLLQYTMRILASRMYPSMVKDEQNIADVIKRRLVRRPDKDTGITEALRFEESFGKLRQQSVMKERWSVLYMLSCLSHDASSAAAGIPNVPLGKPFLSADLEDLEGARRKDVTMFGRKVIGYDSDGYPIFEKVSKPSQKRVTSAADRAAELRRAHLQQTIQANTSYEVPEAVLLKDIIYTFQGIDGHFIKYNQTLDSFAVVPDVGVPHSMRNLVCRITELGWLYRRICLYLKATLDSPAVGLVEQSFCGVMQKELTDYFRLVAVLEQQLSEASTTSTRSELNFTLRRVYVWIQDPLERLRMLAMLTDAASGVKGGALATAVGSFVRHGNPFVSNFIQRIMVEVRKPIYTMIQSWISSGELRDPFGEFFIAGDASVSTDRLWQDKYTVRKAMVPSFISQDMAKKILGIGKSINFIRQCCGNEDWVSQSKLAMRGTESDATENIEHVVTEAAEVTNTQLMGLMMDKFQIRLHCLALKKYLLLGQGDFIQHLMDSLQLELNKPARQLNTHSLMNVLEASVRASNAQYEDQDVLDRLNVRLLKASDSDSGWDIFSLDYLTSNPINVLFTEDAINKYLQVSNFLWRLKRVEHSLSSSWVKHVARIDRLRGLKHVSHVIMQGFQLREEMNHFILTLLNYMMFEVMEASWTNLVAAIDEARDLDELVEAHTTYLNNIVEKALMGASDSKRRMVHHLLQIFESILHFGSVQERLLDRLYGEVERQENIHESANKRTAKGKWGLSREDDAVLDSESTVTEEIAAQFTSQLSAVGDKYHELVYQFLDTCKSHPSADLRFLRLRLDFNEFYDRLRVQRHFQKRFVAPPSSGAPPS